MNHDLHFIEEAIGKERPDRTVDQSARQGFLFGRTPFALEEAAGHFASSIVFLLVMHSKREEVLPRLLLLGEGYVRHHRGFAQCGDYGAVCLTGNLARFQRQRFFAPLDGFLNLIEHLSFPHGASPGPPGAPFHWRPHCRRPQSFACARGQGLTSQMSARI